MRAAEAARMPGAGRVCRARAGGRRRYREGRSRRRPRSLRPHAAGPGPTCRRPPARSSGPTHLTLLYTQAHGIFCTSGVSVRLSREAAPVQCTAGRSSPSETPGPGGLWHADLSRSRGGTGHAPMSPAFGSRGACGVGFAPGGRRPAAEPEARTRVAGAVRSLPLDARGAFERRGGGACAVGVEMVFSA